MKMGRWDGLKIFSEKKLKKTDYIVIVLIGVLLLVIAVPTGSQFTSAAKTSEKNLTSDEEKLKTVLENMEGVGKVKVMITKESEPSGMFSEERSKVEGVVVVAQGAGKATIDKNILDVVMALFDVEVHKIKIVKMSL